MTSSGPNNDDDFVLPFQIETAHALGRIVRLGNSVDEILQQHAYPDPVSELLGEAITLAALLGSAIKRQGRLILQTQSDGPVNILVVNYATAGEIRAYAGFDETRLNKLQAQSDNNKPTAQQLLGDGHLAMTIDQRGDKDRHQGIVGLVDATLSEAAHLYFKQSEQLPTFVRLAVGRHFDAHTGNHGDGSGTSMNWRAGGMLIQTLTSEGGHAQPVNQFAGEEDETGTAITIAGEDEEDWRRISLLSSTLEPFELIDPLLSAEQLLFRLFNEERVRVFEPKALLAKCHCDKSQIRQLLETFSKEDLAEMIDEEQIGVTCEFCNTKYSFSPEEL